MTGPVKFETDTNTRLLVDMAVEVDPSGTTVEIKVDGTWYAATWQGSAVSSTRTVNGLSRTTWRQTARTTGYFAGPDVAVPGSSVVLALGRHPTKTRVTSGQDVITEDSTPVVVG